ncbi:Calcium-transporting ATPase 1 [Gimesia panareensis]|uniref:Calcium-transporting ATPase 1 n=1 Tax=Gimesia panareensis TaxID=2527978 RepID=A0A517QCR4_9PLAN|nr:cation-translocating P-type ATPase [Gimesia panareensis]QDT29401.1 Calcium-transporting ATPase 1 [Gimesia panareensis]
MNQADNSPATWYQLDIETIADRLQSPEQGLTHTEVETRRAEVGLNELVEKQRKSVWMMFLDQFKDFMILVLIAAAVISGIIGEPADTIAITVIVLLNAILGFVQEYRAEKAMAALKKMAAPSANVIREDNVETVPVSQLVPGDRVILEAGNIVPADLRLTEAVQLQIDEAALTGESLPVEKITRVIPDEDLPLGDRKNLAFKGTLITKGRGQGVVTETGMQTQLGQIATLLQDQEEGRTPLQKRLAAFGQKLAYAIFAICIIVFVAGLLRGEPPLLMLLTAISLAVAAIPEALPAVITISLALGARKLVKQHALIRKLPAVETLGSVSYICTDKTGTLTQNRMTVEKVYLNGELVSTDELPATDAESTTEQSLAEKPHTELLLCALSLCNDTRLDNADEVIGDPTETALFELAREKGFLRAPLEGAFPRLAEIPFDAERKLMTTFHPWNEGQVVSITKGAAEEIVARSTHVHSPTEPSAIDRDTVLDHAEQIAGNGLRTLGFGLRIWDSVPETLNPEEVESELTLAGMIGMLDPPRPEAAESVALCRSAGIHPVMITGDHPLTAEVIARRVGIIGEHDAGAVITGRQLEQLSLEELENRIEKIRVYARVSPQQKLKIVQALQDRGHYVAMTGDGVNDAPALKRADIGVAMGITGTDVSKEAAHMILLDDNFATIVKTVKEGRRIFDNIRKFIKYTMTSNLGEIWTIFLAPLLGLPIPLLPIHILWINLVTDGVPGLALTAEPGEKNLMQRPPRDPKENIFAHGLGAQMIWVGLLMGAVCLFTQAWFIDRSQTHWQTMVFTVLCLSQMGNVLAIRSERESFFSQGPLSNKPLFAAVLLTFILQMATIYVPVLNTVFKTAPLTAGELAVTLALSSIVFLAVEVEKALKRRKSSA